MLTGVNAGKPSAALEAAIRVLRSDGPYKLTMRNVAAEAGVTATALYRHFRDKDDLLRAIHREVYAAFRRSLGSEPDAGDARVWLHLAFERYLGFALEEPNFYRFLFVEPHGIGVSRYPDDFQSGSSATFRLLRGVVESCMGAGVLRAGDATDAALSMFAHMHGLIMLHFAGRFGGDSARFREFYFRSMDHLVGGLG